MAPIEQTDSIKVLFLAANPSDTQPLDIKGEFDGIKDKVRSARFHECLIPIFCERDVTLDDLGRLLLEHEPDIVHFSGHGDELGRICLAVSDPNAGPRYLPVPVAAIANLFHDLRQALRHRGREKRVLVVVLNACYTDAQARALADAGIDCAVGMASLIPDRYAIAFASEFYQALSFGLSVGDAINIGRIRLEEEGFRQPKMLVRCHRGGGVPLSTLFVVKKPEVPAPSPVQEDPGLEEGVATELSGEWTGEYLLHVTDKRSLHFYVKVELDVTNRREIGGKWTGILRTAYRSPFDGKEYKEGDSWSFHIHGRPYRASFLRMDYEPRYALDLRFGSMILYLTPTGQLTGKIAGHSTISGRVVTGSITLTKTDPAM